MYSNPREFFEFIKAGELGELEIYLEAERLTNKFELKRLKLLLEDINHFIYLGIKRGHYSESVIEYYKKAESLSEKNKRESGVRTPRWDDLNNQLNENNQEPDHDIQFFLLDFYHCYKFRELIEDEIANKEISSDKIRKEEGDINVSLFFFKNNFDNTKVEDVYTYFKEGLVDKGFLTEDDLGRFLKLAFEEIRLPQKRFKLNTPTKQKAVKVFHGYYKTIAGKPGRKQKQYAALLGEYFEGYDTNNVSTNFSK